MEIKEKDCVVAEFFKRTIIKAKGKLHYAFKRVTNLRKDHTNQIRTKNTECLQLHQG